MCLYFCQVLQLIFGEFRVLSHLPVQQHVVEQKYEVRVKRQYDF